MFHDFFCRRNTSKNRRKTQPFARIMGPSGTMTWRVSDDHCYLETAGELHFHLKMTRRVSVKQLVNSISIDFLPSSVILLCLRTVGSMA